MSVGETWRHPPKHKAKEGESQAGTLGAEVGWRTDVGRIHQNDLFAVVSTLLPEELQPPSSLESILLVTTEAKMSRWHHSLPAM